MVERGRKLSDTLLSLCVNAHVIVEREHIQQLIDALLRRGYHVIGPTVREQAIIYDTLTSVSELPIGYTDEQAGGSYRLKRRADQALFGYNVGPHSWKRFLHPPVVRLWRAQRTEKGLQVAAEEPASDYTRMAFLGVRSCELSAIAIQDTVFLQGPYQDVVYRARRQDLCVIAVNCGQAGGTCFCASMQTGPKASSGFDLALTEILEEKRHYFLVEIGSELGCELLREVTCSEAHTEELCRAEEITQEVTGQMGRTMNTVGIKELLYRNPDHPRWDDVATRCLSCANCTMVCPTCFCTTGDDTNDLVGKEAERWRRWDSCFTASFSYISGGSIRTSTKSRYRQWMTHKLASWIDQFGTSGCVGCGRCITWCPVGIDITEEVQAIRDSEQDTATKEQES